MSTNLGIDEFTICILLSTVAPHPPPSASLSFLFTRRRLISRHPGRCLPSHPSLGAGTRRLARSLSRRLRATPAPALGGSIPSTFRDWRAARGGQGQRPTSKIGQSGPRHGRYRGRRRPQVQGLQPVHQEEGEQAQVPRHLEEDPVGSVSFCLGVLDTNILLSF